MTGSLLQLSIHARNDIYLVGNPQITHFKSLYKRHTNFAMESIEQTLNGTSSPALGDLMSSTISKPGDLINGMYLEITFVGTANKPWPLQALIDYVEIRIGDQIIDKHYGDWFHIWNELTLPMSKKAQYYNMTGHNNDGVVSPSSQTCYLPFLFWFCKNPGLALPMIALLNTDVTVNIQLNTGYATTSADTYRNSVASISSVKLFADYVFLDVDEKRRFAQTSHEYLFEQIKHTGDEEMKISSTSTTDNDINVVFKGYIKELVWALEDRTNGATNHAFNYIKNSSARTFSVPSDTQPSLYSGDVAHYLANKPSYANDTEFISNVELLFNGQNRFSSRSSRYFSHKQIMDHHSGTPPPGIYVYSFALKPEEYQPTGQCDFNKFDDIVLRLRVASMSAPAPKLKLFGVSYNVLRIMSGMGGLAYNS